LALAAWGVISIETSYRASVRLTIVMLFVLAVSLGRRDGLSWRRALLAGFAIIAVTLVVIGLESRLH
jgi:hypothetical protein